MENEQQKYYELRNRSRSRSETPQIPSRTMMDNEISDHHYELRNKSRDRSVTPGEVSSSRRSSSRSIPSNLVKARNKNMDVIAEQSGNIVVDDNSDMQSKTSETVVVTKSSRKIERRSERQRIKKQICANGQSEVDEDCSDIKSEIRERKRESITPKRIMTSDYSSEEGDREDVPSRPGSAYEFYKQHGEYWNKFPKTDYTYSQASTCRYEVAPGVMAIPNMSRRSLHSDNNFVVNQVSNNQSISQFSKESCNMDEIHRNLSDMVPQLLPHIRGADTAGHSVIYKRTHVECSTRREFVYDSAKDNQINERYESWANPLLNSHKANRYRLSNNIDSDTELDESIVSNYRYQLQNVQRFNKFTSLISTWIYAILHFITFGKFKKREFSSSHIYCRYEESKWNRLRRHVFNIMQHLYLSIVKVVLLDSWLLSRASIIRQRFHERRTKLFWLILLPFLLTIGCWFLPYILSTTSLLSKQMLSHIKEKTSIVQNYPQEDLKSNHELMNIVSLLISRVQHLETVKAEQSQHLLNVTQVLEELKRSDSKTWEHYNEKLLNLEQVLEDQNKNKEGCKLEEFDHVKVEVQVLKHLYRQLKSCCDTTLRAISDENIKKQTDKIFAGYFGDSFSKGDVVRIFETMNQKLQNDNFQKSDEEKSPKYEISQYLNADTDEIRKIVLEILRIYDADKTGRVDFALESAGGQVISIRCTQQYNIETRLIKIFGVSIPYSSDINDPRTVIQGNKLQPGMCWAFQDFPGYLLIKLRSQIYVTGFTVEHASRFNLPNGEMKSAPRKFDVWGLTEENDMDPVMFGEYEFLDSDESLQYFPVQNMSITSPYEYVELRIHSNHGQLEYTCLYRFRIHGNLA